MKLETRMRQSINHRLGTVVSRSDVASLGSQTQVTNVLNLLLQNGELVRISRGVYAKAKREADGDIIPMGGVDQIIHDAANKLKLVLHGNSFSFSSKSTEEDEIVVETETPRISLKMMIHGKVVWFRTYHKLKKKDEFLFRSQRIPTREVAEYVKKLSSYHKVDYTFNSLDLWANTVTRLAGDKVEPDRTEDLLVALKRAGKLSKKEFAEIFVNYLREQR